MRGEAFETVLGGIRARAHSWCAAWLAATLVAGCGGGGDPPSAASSSTGGNAVAVATTPGRSPFVSFATLVGPKLDALASVSYTIAPKPGSASRPVSVTYTLAGLKRRGYVDPATGDLTLPVFGLYEGYLNAVQVALQFTDQSVQTVSLNIGTAAYADAAEIYDQPKILVPRAPGSALGFDFFALKSPAGPIVVVDTDGAIRWVGPPMSSSMAAAYQNGGFEIGSSTSEVLTRAEWDGSVTNAELASSSYLSFNHNVDAGKTGLVGELDSPVNLESTAVEFDASGNVLQTWDFAALLSNYMRSLGDDPTQFVRPGEDWFHLNATTYDPSDDTLIASSRQNFVIKVDYKTGNIVWILGDPTKYWYTFASLRAKALTLQGPGLYPIGQHAVSITSDGLLMLFNDGFPSNSEPPGAPLGASRTYSAVTAYAIDPVARTAQQAWNFDHGQDIFSGICSSAYEGSDKSLLVDYANADDGAAARLIGLDANHDVVFDFQYVTSSACGTAWNAIPVPLAALTLE